MEHAKRMKTIRAYEKNKELFPNDQNYFSLTQNLSSKKTQ